MKLHKKPLVYLVKFKELFNYFLSSINDFRIRTWEIIYEFYIIIFTLGFTFSKQSNFFQNVNNTSYKARFVLAYFDPVVVTSLIILIIILFLFKIKKDLFQNFSKRGILFLCILIIITIVNIINNKPLDQESLLKADFSVNCKGCSKDINIIGINASSTLDVYSGFNFGQIESAPMSGLYMAYNTRLQEGLPAGTAVSTLIGAGSYPILTVYAQADGNGYQGIESPRVGINTTTPEYTLDVYGDAQIGGNLFIKANCIVVSGNENNSFIYLKYSQDLKKFEEVKENFCK